MWAIQGFRSELSHLEANLKWAQAHGFDYVRILCEVGWSGREIDPSWSNYKELLGKTIDLIYDKYGMRVELTIIGKGTSANPKDVARDVADVVRDGRQHKVINFEMINEDGPVGIPTMKEMARIVRDRAANLIALTSPGSWDDLRNALGGPVDAFTMHSDRDVADNGWRAVRQSYDAKDVRVWLSANEPPGPASSVEQLTNPLQLAMLRAVSVMCGGSAFVFHTGTGVYGDGKPYAPGGNPRFPRPPNFWEIDSIEGMVRAVRNIDKLLPEGVENWQVANTQWTPPNPVAPFQPAGYWPEPNTRGVNKAYSALSRTDGRVIQMPCGLLGDVEFTASYPLRNVTVYDPLTLKPVREGLNFQQGEKMTLPGSADSMVAYIIHGMRA